MHSRTFVIFALAAGLATACSPGRADSTLPVDASHRPDGAAVPPTGRDASTDAEVPPHPDPQPTGSVAADEVRINGTMRLQVVDGFGANAYAYPWANDMGWNWESAAFVFEELDIEYVRLASWFVWWEPNNDDSDPNHTNWEGFSSVHDIIDNHDIPFAQWLTERDIEVALGVWDVGDWLAGGSPRRIPRAMYPELGESIASYVVHMREAGVPQPYVEVQNEPGIEAAIQYESPEALRDAALVVLDQLDAHGLTDVMLHGPNYHQPSEAADWAEVWLSNERLRSRTAALSYHSWWDEDRAPFDAIKEVADRHDKPVWVTETGYCALPWGCFDGAHFLLPETWETAWDFAMSLYRALKWTQASRLYHWSAVGNDAFVGPGGERYPTFYVVKQFANWIPKGGRMLEVASGNEQVLALAFVAPDGTRTAILLNSADSTRSMRITSVESAIPGTAAAVASQRDRHEQVLDVSGPAEDGSVTVDLPGQSVVSLRLSP